MSTSREQYIKRLNKLHEELDNLSSEVVEALAEGAPPPKPYDAEEVITRLAKEVRYERLNKKLYGY